MWPRCPHIIRSAQGYMPVFCLFMLMILLLQVIYSEDTAESFKGKIPEHEGKSREVTKEKDRALKIVLVTQYRGGSTFLGEIFNQDPNTFYWYEPLVQPSFDFKHRNKFNSLFQHDNGSFRKLPEDFEANLQDILFNILNCRMSEVDRRVLRHYFVTKWNKSKKIIPYRKCLGGNSRDESIDHCLSVLTTACTESNSHVIKTIRFLLHMSEPFLHRDPTVKFILYVRDPRGTILSRWDLEKKRNQSRKDHLLEADALCRRLLYDHQEFQRLKEEYPDNFYMVRYEELSTEPITSVSKLYAFLGRNVPTEVLNWIPENTNSASNKTGGLATGHRNSSAVASRWKWALTTDEKALITSQCGEILKLYSYPL